MEWLKDWLLSITAVALIATLTDALCPGGFSKKMVRFAGGILLLLTVISPFRGVDSGKLGDSLARYRLRYDDYAQTISAENQEKMKGIIAQQTAAYISDKAAALNIQEAQVWVTCRLTEDGVPAPAAVKVRGRGEGSAWEALSRAITADFALEADAQTLERTDVP